MTGLSKSDKSARQAETSRDRYPELSHSQRLAQIRSQVEIAHMAVQRAQKLAYASDWGVGPLAPLRVRLALNRAQSTLIKLLVHRLPARRP